MLTPVYEKEVLGSGPEDARIMIVGQSPAAHELRSGLPFMGQAGGKLDECMNIAGMVRGFCRLTNLFKTMTIKSGTGLFVERDVDGEKKRLKVFDAKEGLIGEGLEAQKDLVAEIQQVRPNVVVTLGKEATFALTGLNAITKVRGSVVESNVVKGLKVIPTIHPSAALRNYLWMYYIAHDLRKAEKQSSSPRMPVVSRHYIKAPDYEQVLEYLYRINRTSATQAVDIEVYNEEITCFGIGTDAYGIVIPFTNGKGGNYWSIEEELVIWKAIGTYMENKGATKIYQNGMFDMYVLANKYGILHDGQVEDTMIAMNMLYPDFEKGLAFISSVYTNEPYYKDDFKMWSQAQQKKEGRIETLWTYNEKDVAVTYESWVQLKQELKVFGNLETYEWTMRLMPALLYMQCRGIRVSKDELLETRKILVEIEERLENELYEIVGRELNPRSPKQLKEYFYGELGIKAYHNRKTGKESVDDNALKRLAAGTKARAPLREAKLIREIRSVRKLRSTYMDTTLDKDGRLRCSINPAGTKNGRLSTSKTIFGTGTNLQNLPQQFKKFLVADEGKMFIEIDKKQGEWVLCAYMADDPNMIEVVEKGLDAHTATAALAFGVPPELVVKENKIVGHETDVKIINRLRREQLPELGSYDIPSTMSVRQAGKKSNHGLNYDMGAGTFGLVNETSMAEAKRVVNAYHQAYPNIRGVFHEHVRMHLGKDRVLTNVFGRKRLFLDRWGDTLKKDGYAFPAQSGLVDLVNRGIVETWEDEGNAKFLEQLIQVHDSVLYQYSAEDFLDMAYAILAAGEYLNPTMVWEGREFTIGNDIKVGLNWAGYDKENNPQGMIDLDWDESPENMAWQLKHAWDKLSGKEA